MSVLVVFVDGVAAAGVAGLVLHGVPPRGWLEVCLGSVSRAVHREDATLLTIFLLQCQKVNLFGNDQQVDLKVVFFILWHPDDLHNALLEPSNLPGLALFFLDESVDILSACLFDVFTVPSKRFEFLAIEVAMIDLSFIDRLFA